MVKLATGGIFCYCRPTASVQSIPSARVPRISVDVVSTKDVPLGSPRYISLGELYPLKTPHFGDSVGISSLNVYVRTSAQKKRIITLDG
jgi:hypothetical protein